MKTRSLCLTEAQANELQAAFLSTQEAIAKTRFQAVRLYGTGYSVTLIQDICGCTTRSLLNWSRAYRERGLTALLDHRQGGNRAHLKPEQIEACKISYIAIYWRHCWGEMTVSARDSLGQWLISPAYWNESAASSIKAIPLI